MSVDLQYQREVLKRVATALKGAEVPFALAGGYAVWARGGQESTHDVDVIVPPDQIPAAWKALLEYGFEAHTFSEDWLVKVIRQDVVVDVIHRLPTGDVDSALLARCDALVVDSVVMPVMQATDIILCRLLALSDHSCDFAPMLAFVRSLREQIDWGFVHRQCKDSPFARAFLGLAVELDIAEAPDA